MAKYVAFLRGMGLGKRRPPSTKLVSIFEALGHTDVATFIASGNVVFSTNKRSTAALEKESSQALEKELGYAVEVFARPAELVTEIARSTPFPDEDQNAINVHVAFMAEEPSPQHAKALESIRSDYDRFKVTGREFFWLCRGTMSASTVWEQPEIKKIKLPSCTLRNMTTIRKLTAKYLSS